MGMSSTHVTPAWTAARVPVEKSSFWVMPGSRRCTCGSVDPRRIVMLDPRSIFSSPPRTILPTATILPSAIPISVYCSSPLK